VTGCPQAPFARVGGQAWEVRINTRVLTFVIALVLTACGGGDDGADLAADSQSSSTTQTADPTTTAAESTTTTTATTLAAGGQDSDFCETLDADMAASEDVDVFDLEAFEERSRESLATIEDLRGSVPPELEDSYDILLEANREWLEALDEYDWDIMSIPEDEPRMLRMGSDEMLDAAETILEYCGIDLFAEEPSDPGPQGDLDGLMPPGAGEELASSPILMVESSASYEELVDHYTDLLGRGPVNEGTEGDDRSATFIAQYEGTQTAVFIEESAGQIVVSISTG
jgi:hypothetical protein